MSEKNVDLFGKQGTTGDVAERLKSGMSVYQMRPWVGRDGKAYITVFKGGDPKKKANYQAMPINTNATLRRDEWKQLDEAILKVGEERLTGIQSLISRGLTFNLGNAMGTTVLENHLQSDAANSIVSMDGATRGQNDRPKYSTVYTPIPIIHNDYEINARQLEASRNLGNPLDTTMAERATRKNNETLEEMLFTDTSYSFQGGTIYSLMNFPHRNTLTLNGAWDDSGTSASDILDDAHRMKKASINAKYYGPFELYVPSNYEHVLDQDYDVSGTSLMTIRERLLKINGIESIKVVDKLPDDNVFLVQMTSDVIRLVNGFMNRNVEWATEGGMITKYKVMTIRVPQLRADYDGNTGIVHGST